ncbi:MAG: HAMP domain-containing histidine kinase [Anaerolineales bacterium]|nr:HAMP domain-containing histidine kinase [Anaerolineales bacterium]
MVVTEENRVEILRQAFPKLDDASLQLLSQAAREELFPAESVLCHQGDIGDCLFVVTEGEVAVLVRTDAENEVQVNTVGAYSYLGEMALLIDESIRSATLRALVDSRALVIEREPFLQVADQNPILLRRLASQLTQHLRNNDRAVITELRTKNEELHAAYADLAAQEQMRREFVTTLSHELRTPLTSMRGYLQLMNRGMIKGDSLNVALDSITRNVEKMVGMTNNLLVLYEMELTLPEFVELSLADLLVDAVRKTHEIPEYEQAAISVDIAKGMPILHGDKGGLTLALHALIENGVKFSPEETPVEINATAPEGGWVRIDIIDQGVGIPKNAQEKIFEPFYRLEHAEKGGAKYLFDGIGIGLSIAKFIVERHGGRIELQSQPEKGSVFSLFLPARGSSRRK